MCRSSLLGNAIGGAGAAIGYPRDAINHYCQRLAIVAGHHCMALVCIAQDIEVASRFATAIAGVVAQSGARSDRIVGEAKQFGSRTIVEIDSDIGGACAQILYDDRTPVLPTARRDALEAGSKDLGRASAYIRRRVDASLNLAITIPL